MQKLLPSKFNIHPRSLSVGKSLKHTSRATFVSKTGLPLPNPNDTILLRFKMIVGVSTFIVDQNVLSNALRNNGVSKVLSILLSDFVSRGSERSLWRHHGNENKQLKSAQCQRKVSTISGGQICKVWHLAGISGISIMTLGSTLVGSLPGHHNKVLRYHFLNAITSLGRHWERFAEISYGCSHSNMHTLATDANNLIKPEFSFKILNDGSS